MQFRARFTSYAGWEDFSVALLQNRELNFQLLGNAALLGCSINSGQEMRLSGLFVSFPKSAFRMFVRTWFSVRAVLIE